LAGEESRSSAVEVAEPTDTRTLQERGKKVFSDNCSMCHYYDKEATKVGPGLKGLFERELTPARKRPVTDENIADQIQNGSDMMPPFPHIKGEDLLALIEYLKSL
jgi:mono/diheme cytochrome c family protein